MRHIGRAAFSQVPSTACSDHDLPQAVDFLTKIRGGDIVADCAAPRLTSKGSGLDRRIFLIVVAIASVSVQNTKHCSCMMKDACTIMLNEYFQSASRSLCRRQQHTFSVSPTEMRAPQLPMLVHQNRRGLGMQQGRIVPKQRALTVQQAELRRIARIMC
jgi:hypothetical protein